MIHIMKNAPNSLIYAVTLIIVTIILAFTVLAITGADSTELRSFLNTILNIAAVALSGGGVIVAGAAAKSASAAERQTNGQMSNTIRKAIAEGVRVELARLNEKPNDDTVT